jgi:hypothetical protein
MQSVTENIHFWENHGHVQGENKNKTQPNILEISCNFDCFNFY